MRPTSGRTPNCGASGRCKVNRHWWTRAARATAKRPAIIRRCAWRRGRWNGWNWMGTSNSETAAAFLEQLRERPGGWLNVIWDNASARDWSKIWRGGAGSSESSRTEPEAGEPAGATARTATPTRPSGAGPERKPRAICACAARRRCRSGSANSCRVDSRKDEVKRRCRTVLRSRSVTLLRNSRFDSQHPPNAHPTLALV